MPVNLIYTSEPKLHINTPGTGLMSPVAIPAGAIDIGRRPSVVEYRKGFFTTGMFNRVLAFFPEYGNQFVIAGLRAAVAAITSAAGAAGVITGTVIYYIAPVHKYGTITVHEGNLSPGSTPLALTNQKGELTNIPATALDSRTTHWRIYRSTDGALPRVVTDLAIGAVTFSDNVATGALGATPLLNAAGTNVSSNRGVPPYTRFAELYNTCAFYAGDPLFPSRIWRSEAGEPESVGALTFFDLPGGETVTGLKRVGDQLVIGCMQCYYDLQGYSPTDYRLRKIHPSLGLISHFSMAVANDGVKDILLAASQSGVITYDGVFHQVMEDHRDQWRDEYAANGLGYEDSIAIVDLDENVYRLLIAYPFAATTKSRPWIGHLTRWHQALDGSGSPQMHWTRDLRDREDKALGYFSDGTGRRLVHSGSPDGFIRRENVLTNGDDDGDTYQKKWVHQGAHDYFEDVGGDRVHGKLFTDLTVFLWNDDQEAKVFLFAGDDPAVDGKAKQKTIAPGRVNGKVGRRSYHFLPMVSGQGLTRRIEILAPVGIEYGGDAGAWIDGLGARPASG